MVKAKPLSVLTLYGLVVYGRYTPLNMLDILPQNLLKYNFNGIDLHIKHCNYINLILFVLYLRSAT